MGKITKNKKPAQICSIDVAADFTPHGNNFG